MLRRVLAVVVLAVVMWPCRGLASCGMGHAAVADSVLSADSGVQIPLCAGDRVLLFKSRYCARMIKLKSDSFYRVLRQRLAAAGR